MNGGMYSLTKNGNESDLAIAQAGTFISTAIENLDGMSGVTLSAQFAWGSGGTTCKSYVQTRFGSVWVDIACFAFATAAAHKLFNLTNAPQTSPLTPGDGALADNTVVDGILGDALRTKTIVVGTYAGSTILAVRASAR